MSTQFTRRAFLTLAATCSTLAGLSNATFLSSLSPVTADESRLDPNIVRLRPEIEPLVALLENTPRERVLEVLADRIRLGTSYREVVAALLLAGVRNVQPRPSVGFKFHAVLVVNSAHIASLSSPDTDRWLPIFWAVDNFKSAQSRDIREGNWTMAPVNTLALPPAHKAAAAFRHAMDTWDVPSADTSVASLARTAGAEQIFELFFHYGMRDFRSIGHKAIYTANSYRTLQAIGWQHAEPVLRSLAYALLNHQGEPSPGDNDLAADQPWRRNQRLAANIRTEWQGGVPDPAATVELLATLRTASADDACDLVVEMLNRGVAPSSLWDALLCGAGELLILQPGILALHAVTSTNALRFAFQASGVDQTRRLLLLQNAAFLALFRQQINRNRERPDARIDQLRPMPLSTNPSAALEEIFADVNNAPSHAAGKTLQYLNDQTDARPLIDAARRLIFLKGTNAHDYKFSSAVLEDFYHVSPQWRNQYLAASVFNLRGSGDRDNNLVERTRAALTG